MCTLVVKKVDHCWTEWLHCCKIQLQKLAGYEVVNQHDQTGQKAGLAGYEVVNQHDQTGQKAGLAGYELVDQLVLVTVGAGSWSLKTCRFKT